MSKNAAAVARIERRESDDADTAAERERIAARYAGDNAFRDQHTPIPEHGGPVVERVSAQILDAEDMLGWPFKALDAIDIMRRRGVLTDDQVAAAREFRDKWDCAHLEALKAADVGRVPVSGANPQRTMSDSVYAARRWIWRRVDGLGGLASPSGSIVVHVVGFGDTIRDWCVKQAFRTRSYDQRVASGILIGALDSLYAFSQRGMPKTDPLTNRHW